MKRVSYAFYLFLVFSACQKDEPAPVVPDPEITLLTFKQDVSSVTSLSDDWIFITNENGNLLDIKHFEAGDAIVLKSDEITASDKINVTIFHYLQPTTETIDFTSYLGISTGQTWIYGKRNGFLPTGIGLATMNIANARILPPPPITVSTNLGYSSPRAQSPTTVSIPLYKGIERIFAATNIEDIPSYFEAEGLEDGDIIDVDYNTDFKPLQNIFTQDLSGSTSYAGNVYGLSNETGVDPYYVQGFMNYSTAPGPMNTITWGYNNGFDLYRTYIRKSLGKVSRHYFKLGDPVTTIPFPNHTFTPITTDLNGFSFSISEEYHLRNSRWTVLVPDYQSVLSWRVYAPPGGKQIFPEIPDQIKLLYPSLTIESLVLKDNTFTNYLDDFSYADFINGEMNISTSKKPHSTEYQTVIIQN